MPVIVAAARAPTAMSREVGMVRRQAMMRCQDVSSTGAVGSSSLWTISIHCGPAWIRAFTERTA